MAIVEELHHPQHPDGVVGDAVAEPAHQLCGEQVQCIIAETYNTKADTYSTFQFYIHNIVVTFQHVVPELIRWCWPSIRRSWPSVRHRWRSRC